MTGCAQHGRPAETRPAGPEPRGPDGMRYLQRAHSFAGGSRGADALPQSGYSVLITPAPLEHDMGMIPLARHLARLATAAVVCAVLSRFGVSACWRRWPR